MDVLTELTFLTLALNSAIGQNGWHNLKETYSFDSFSPHHTDDPESPVTGSVEPLLCTGLPLVFITTIIIPFMVQDTEAQKESWEQVGSNQSV